MKTAELYEKITDQMPTKEGYYMTDIGICECEFVPDNIGLKPGPRWKYEATPKFWLMKVEATQFRQQPTAKPTDEELMQWIKDHTVRRNPSEVEIYHAGMKAYRDKIQSPQQPVPSDEEIFDEAEGFMNFLMDEEGLKYLNDSTNPVAVRKAYARWRDKLTKGEIK